MRKVRNIEYIRYLVGKFLLFLECKENRLEANFSSDNIEAPNLIVLKLNSVCMSQEELEKINKRYPKLTSLHNCKNRLMDDDFVSQICRIFGDCLISLGIGGISVSDKRFEGTFCNPLA